MIIRDRAYAAFVCAARGLPARRAARRYVGCSREQARKTVEERWKFFMNPSSPFVGYVEHWVGGRYYGVEEYDGERWYAGPQVTPTQRLPTLSMKEGDARLEAHIGFYRALKAGYEYHLK